MDDSPFGKAFEIYKNDVSKQGGRISGSLALYCVECGIRGNLRFQGQARFTILGGLETGNVQLDGNLAAGLQIGIDALAQISEKFKREIFTLGIPGFSVPGVFTVGPYLKLEAELELGM